MCPVKFDIGDLWGLQNLRISSDLSTNLSANVGKSLSHFSPMFHYYTPPEIIEMEHWPKID